MKDFVKNEPAAARRKRLQQRYGKAIERVLKMIFYEFCEIFHTSTTQCRLADFLRAPRCLLDGPLMPPRLPPRRPSRWSRQALSFEDHARRYPPLSPLVHDHPDLLLLLLPLLLLLLFMTTQTAVEILQGATFIPDFPGSQLKQCYPAV